MRPAGTRPPPWIALVVFAVAWLAQGATLAADWGPDGAALVRDGPAGLEAAFAPDAWPLEAEPGAWRPVTLASYALETRVWRADDGSLAPFGFRVTNLFLHALAAVLLLVVLVRVVPGRPAVAVLGALLLAVHPVATVTLGPMGGRADLLALVFSLAAAGLALAGGRGRFALLPLAALAFLLALLARETAFGLAPAIVLLALAAARGGERRGPALALLPLVLAAVVYLVLAPALRLAPAGEAFSGVARAGAVLLVPLVLVRDAIEVPAAAAWPAGATIGVGIVVLALLLLAGRAKRPRTGPATGGIVLYGLAAGVAAFLVAGRGVVEARFAYGVAAGLLLVLATGLAAVAAPGGATRPVGLAGLVLVGLALGFLSWREAAAWRTQATWTAALEARHPRHRALLLREAERLRHAAALEQRYLQGLPADYAEDREWGAELRRLLARARHVLDRLDALDPRDPDVARHRAAVLLLQGQAAAAERVLERGLTWEPGIRIDLEGALTVEEDLPPSRRPATARAVLLLAEARTAQGRGDRALDAYRFAARLAPEDGEVLARAGTALARVPLYAEAIDLLERAVEKQREDLDLLRLLDRIRREALEGADRALRAAQREENARRYREAGLLYEQVLSLDPRRLQAWLRLAWIRRYQGRYAESLAMLERARRLVEETGGPEAEDALARIAEERAAVEEQKRRDEQAERDMFEDGNGEK